MTPHPTENPLHSVATEFVTESFETEVEEATVDALAAEVESIVRALRERVDDDRLEALLHSQPGESVLTSADSSESEDPEPLTQRQVIEPLLGVLGYDDLSVEAGDLSPDHGRTADYAVDLRAFEEIDSNRLLVEAEPLNKRLDRRDHGLGQVKDWLERDKFEADFGIATDGLRWVLLKYDRDTYSFDRLAEVSLQAVFVVAFENVTGRQRPTDEWLDESSREVLREFARVFGFENFRSIADEAREVIKRTKQAITDEFYDEYVRLVFGITDAADGADGAGEGRTARSLIGDGVVAPEDATGDDVRLFAVELMNRLIFIKFLEDRGLVEPTLLRDLLDDHESGLNPDSFYESYLEPLFFGILDERPGERTERVRTIALYEDVPYLNGGLFRPTVENGGTFTETDFDVRDSVVTSIIDLLERYSFSSDGSPTDLDPSVLGNVFEKTINHITTDSGDTKKELGAYYTPDEITRFCAEQTVQPALLERFGDRLVEEWDWNEGWEERYDDVYDLIDALPSTNLDLIEDLLGVVDRFRALDPACGSGHFLTSVQGEIVSIRKALYEKHDDDPADWELHKQSVVQNVYGVDIVEPAVEIAKLRLWLSIIAEVEPETVGQYDDEELALPNVVFNVRQGNSLIGFTELVETREDGYDDGKEQFLLGNFGPNAVREKYGGVIEQIELHKQATDTDEATKFLHRAERLISEFSAEIDEKVLQEFHEAGLEDVTLEQVQSFDPFHWVLEFAPVYENDGFDAIVGNPPWDVLTVNRDDFFSRYEPTFRTYSSPQKDEVQAEWLEKTDEDGVAISEKWEEYQHGMEVRANYFNGSPSYELQSPTIDGRGVASENDLSALFLERVFDISRKDGRVALVLPGNIFNGAASKDLRANMLDECQIESIVGFENHGIFPEIDNRYQFGITVFQASGRTDDLRGIFQQRDPTILENIDNHTFEITRGVLEGYSPKARIFPFVTSPVEVSVIEKIIRQPPLEEKDAWWACILTKELHEPSDKHLFVESESEGDYPIYSGENIHQFFYNNSIDTDIEPVEYWSIEVDQPGRSAKYRVREKKSNKGDLKRALYEAFEEDASFSAHSQVEFVNKLLEEAGRNEPLDESDVLLDCTEYRIAYRDVARATDERSMIATVLPPDVLCLHTLQTFQPYTITPEQAELSEKPLHSAYERIFTDRELFAAIGLLNSLPFDFLMRTKIDTHIVKYKLEESQVPRLTDGDEWFHYISDRAARLNCYGDEFEEMRERLGGIDPATEMAERKRLQAEIDAAAFHAYGLDREETAFVLEDFHRVQNPRLMTEDYFEMVLEKYDELAEDWPME